MTSKDSGAHLTVPGQGGVEPELLENQPFDEAFDVQNAENIVTPVPSTVSSRRSPDDMNGYGGGDHGDTPPNQGYDSHDEVEYDDNSNMEDDLDRLDDDYSRQNPGSKGGFDADDADDADDDYDTSRTAQRGGGDYNHDDEDAPEIHWDGEYNPKEFSHLRVDSEVRELFKRITDYRPQIADIGTRLDPFIPDFIPAVGDIDAMIKIPRVDGVDLGLGLSVVDEPCAAQSDPTVLDLQLRSISKTTSVKAVEVKQIADPKSNPKALDSWITSITELHREKPPQSIQYSTEMPDIELLMQEWPDEVEELLKSVELPGADLDVPLSVYVSIVCALLDIPIHKSKIESLHLLFSLFVEFKNSQHFRTEEDAKALKEVDPLAEAEPDVMVL